MIFGRATPSNCHPGLVPGSGTPRLRRIMSHVTRGRATRPRNKSGVAVIVMLLLLSTPAHARQMDDMGVAVLRTIDKLSARTTTFEIPVDKTVKFGASLFIKVRACRKASALDLPESAAFLQIWERKPSEETAHWVFSGWMFASSPGVSAMDHPIYDVWVIDCKSTTGPAKPQTFSTETAPASAAPDGKAPPEEKKPDEKKPEEKKEEKKPEAAPPAKEEKKPVPAAVAPLPEVKEKPAPAALDQPAVPEAPPESEDEGAAPNKGD